MGSSCAAARTGYFDEANKSSDSDPTIAREAASGCGPDAIAWAAAFGFRHRNFQAVSVSETTVVLPVDH
jgi:hypothetical protein